MDDETLIRKLAEALRVELNKCERDNPQTRADGHHENAWFLIAMAGHRQNKVTNIDGPPNG